MLERIFGRTFAPSTFSHGDLSTAAADTDLGARDAPEKSPKIQRAIEMLQSLPVDAYLHLFPKAPTAVQQLSCFGLISRDPKCDPR